MQRVLAALQVSSPDLLPTALDALYHCHWVEGNGDINNPAVFAPLLEQALGKEVAARVVEEGRGEAAKQKVTENTERAFESGAFGLPWFECVDGEGVAEGFWGFDHLGQVVRFLGLGEGGGGEGMPLGMGLVEGMKAML